MKTRAAVLEKGSMAFEIVELDVDEPRNNEVHITYTAAGLCHSDLHLIDGDIVPGSRSWAGTRDRASSRRSGRA